MATASAEGPILPTHSSTRAGVQSKKRCGAFGRRSLLADSPGGCRGAELHFAPCLLIGNAMPMAVKLNAAVDVDAGRPAIAAAVTLVRQRMRRGTVRRVEQRLARAFVIAEGSRTEPCQRFADGLVAPGTAAFAAPLKSNVFPPAGRLRPWPYRDVFSASLGSWPPIADCPLFVCAAQVARNDDLRHTAGESKRSRVRVDPAATCLYPCGFRERAVAGAEHGDGVARRSVRLDIKSDQLLVRVSDCPRGLAH